MHFISHMVQIILDLEITDEEIDRVSLYPTWFR